MYNKFDARFIDFNPFLFHNIFHFLISTNSKGTKRKKRKGKKTEGESWIGFKSVGIKLIRSPGFRCINVEWNSILGGASIYRYPTQPLCYPFFFFFVCEPRRFNCGRSRGRSLGIRMPPRFISCRGTKAK